MENKIKKITVRLTQAEYESLKKKAKAFDGNVSKYARECVLVGDVFEDLIPKTKVLWLIQQILADQELRKNRKLSKILEEVCHQWF